MYTDDDIMTPRERIGDDMLRRMLAGELTGNGIKRNMEEDTRRGGQMNGQEELSSERGRCRRGDEMSASGSFGLEGYPLCMVYAPLQSFGNLYEPEDALKRGTLFREMDLPFMGESIAKGGN